MLPATEGVTNLLSPLVNKCVCPGKQVRVVMYSCSKESSVSLLILHVDGYLLGGLSHDPLMVPAITEFTTKT